MSTGLMPSCHKNGCSPVSCHLVIKMDAVPVSCNLVIKMDAVLSHAILSLKMDAVLSHTILSKKWMQSCLMPSCHKNGCSPVSYNLVMRCSPLTPCQKMDKSCLIQCNKTNPSHSHHPLSLCITPGK